MMFEQISMIIVVLCSVGIIWQIVYSIWDWLTFDHRLAKAQKEADEWYAKAIEMDAQKRENIK